MLTVADVSKRPSARAAMAHPFFTALSSAGAGGGCQELARQCCVMASERCLKGAIPVYDGVECGEVGCPRPWPLKLPTCAV